MANQKHLDLLSSGKTLWNNWRQEYADEQALEPDLHEADLRNVNLRNADLNDANLLGAHLRRADLRNAGLCRSNLKLADLSKADPDTFDRHEAERNEVRDMKSAANKKQGRDITMMEDRYYVQRLTEQVFLIRERKTVDEEPGPDDRIVRSFVFRHDAYRYVDSMNEKQKKLDEHHGQ